MDARLKTGLHYSGWATSPAVVLKPMNDTDQAPSLEAGFLTSAASLKQAPQDDVPEVAFVGRSNAGKSSVLNRITGTRNLARTSKTPGRTQLFNYFDFAVGGRLVDLPGYGYAKVPKRVSDAWQRRIAAYLNNREQLRGLVLVMDARHAFRELDIEIIRGCRAAEMPLLALLNKSDKLSKNDAVKTLREGKERLQLLGGGEHTLVSFSARTGLGAHEARAWVLGRLE